MLLRYDPSRHVARLADWQMYTPSIQSPRDKDPDSTPNININIAVVVSLSLPFLGSSPNSLTPNPVTECEGHDLQAQTPI